MDDRPALRLERCDPARNVLRFYALQVTPSLFGEWGLMRVWGRIGRGEQLPMDWFATQQDAVQAMKMLEQIKRKRGYREKHTLPSGGKENGDIYCGDFNAK